MADFVPREGSGSLFKNTKRDKDSQPNARGECMIGGVIYSVSAWTKKDRNGNPWQSLAFQPKESTAGQYRDARDGPGPGKPPAADFDDEIPF